jgi:phage terminase Nu1 subunit (DNA packaging protein)
MRIVQELPGLGGDRPVHRIGGVDLCDLWGISPGALSQLVKRGIASKLGHDAYDLTTSTRAYIDHLRGTAAGRGGEEQVLTLTGERARLAREQADAQALKNNVTRGEMVRPKTWRAPGRIFCAAFDRSFWRCLHASVPSWGT